MEDPGPLPDPASLGRMAQVEHRHGDKVVVAQWGEILRSAASANNLRGPSRCGRAEQPGDGPGQAVEPSRSPSGQGSSSRSVRGLVPSASDHSIPGAVGPEDRDTARCLDAAKEGGRGLLRIAHPPGLERAKQRGQRLDIPGVLLQGAAIAKCGLGRQETDRRVPGWFSSARPAGLSGRGPCSSRHYRGAAHSPPTVAFVAIASRSRSPASNMNENRSGQVDR